MTSLGTIKCVRKFRAVSIIIIVEYGSILNASARLMELEARLWIEIARPERYPAP